ncbi:MAG: bacteriohemerythrin [Thermodesulfobacteriota bacterium]
MAFMEWSDELSVGVDTFDGHHKRLIELINKLHEAMRAGKGKDVVSGVLKSLRDYTQYHFSQEEKKMIALNFSGYLEHKGQHDNFVGKVDDCIAQYESGSTTITLKLMNFLMDWLRGHIMGTDKKYQSLFAEKNVA